MTWSWFCTIGMNADLQDRLWEKCALARLVVMASTQRQCQKDGMMFWTAWVHFVGRRRRATSLEKLPVLADERCASSPLARLCFTCWAREAEHGAFMARAASDRLRANVEHLLQMSSPRSI